MCVCVGGNMHKYSLALSAEGLQAMTPEQPLTHMAHEHWILSIFLQKQQQRQKPGLLGEMADSDAGSGKNQKVLEHLPVQENKGIFFPKMETCWEHMPAGLWGLLATKAGATSCRILTDKHIDTRGRDARLPRCR